MHLHKPNFPSCFSVLLLALPLLFSALSANAQDGQLADQFERVRLEIDRTGELIQRVGEEVRDADLPRPAELLQRAVDLQKRSGSQFITAQANARDNRMIIAAAQLRESLQLTLSAREYAQQSGRLILDGRNHEEVARRLLDRARERFQSLRELVGDRPSETVIQLAERIRTQLDMAERQLRDGHPAVAVQLAESSMQLMDSAQALLGDARDLGRVAEELERSYELYLRVRDRLGDDPSAAQETALRRAQALLRQARINLKEGKPRVARRRAEEARKILRGLLADGGGGQVDGSIVSRAMASFDADLQAFLDAHPRRPARVDKALERARSHRSRAGEAHAKGQEQRALAQLRAATESLNRVRRALDDGRR